MAVKWVLASDCLGIFIKPFSTQFYPGSVVLRSFLFTFLEMRMNYILLVISYLYNKPGIEALLNLMAITWLSFSAFSVNAFCNSSQRGYIYMFECQKFQKRIFSCLRILLDNLEYPLQILMQTKLRASGRYGKVGCVYYFHYSHHFLCFTISPTLILILSVICSFGVELFMFSINSQVAGTFSFRGSMLETCTQFLTILVWFKVHLFSLTTFPWKGFQNQTVNFP